MPSIKSLTIIAKVRIVAVLNTSSEVEVMKLLYVDVPFEGLPGGDKNRSKAIWKNLSEEFEADLLLIKGPEYATKALEPHQGFRKLYTIGRKEALPHQAKAIYRFHPYQLERFRNILIREQYEVAVFRFMSTFVLAQTVARTLPDCKIAIDVDMLYSRVAEISWHQNHSVKNIDKLWEMLKIKHFEKQAFSHDFWFFFTNSIERDMAVAEYNLDPEKARNFPNLMPMEEPKEYPSPNRSYILYFGSMDSLANQDAFDYLAQEIYPNVREQLRNKGVQIQVAGTNIPDYFYQYQDDCLKIIGQVDDIQEIIAGAEFVILPIRIASGTRTRILEAAQMRKAVLTTSVGTEGFSFGPKELVIRENAEELGQAMLEMLEDKAGTIALGKNLHHTARARYSEKILAERFIKSLKSPLIGVKPKKLRIAIVTNRFHPEAGPAETNIYYQARLLAEINEVTVFSPKRMKFPALERVAGFSHRRLYDVLNNPKVYPNLKEATFCPTLLWYLLIGKYDIIQSYPGINLNSLLAFIAAKIKKKPYIQCFFDFIDYAHHLKTHGKIEKDVLHRKPIRWYQKFVLKHLDYAFSTSEREIEFIKEYNHRVTYSPIPVLTAEFEIPVDKPPLMRTWPEDSFTFLCLGKISKIKGQDIAMEAFCRVASQMPKAKLVFVGKSDSEPEFLENIKMKMLTAGVAEKVHFTGKVERSEAIAWLKHSDINLIPVRFMNSGTVVLESWISETPVLQSDAVDPNLVIDGVNGYLFPNENVEECAEKMLYAYNHKENLKEMALRGKKLVQEKYSYEYLIKLYQSTYQRLMSR